MVINLKHYSQKKGSSACGPVSLKMIFQYYGKKIPIQKIIKQCNPVKGRGTSHKILIQTARKNNFRVSAKNNSSINEIKKFIDKKIPVLVNYINPQSQRGHYSVIKGYTKTHLILADPSNGNNFKITFKKFNKNWFNKKKTSKKWRMVLKNGNSNTIEKH